MMRKCFCGILLCLGIPNWASGSTFDAVVKRIIPSGVSLGASVEDLRLARQNVFAGPGIIMPTPSGAPEAQQNESFMEIVNMGQPGFQSFWYLCSRGRVVGVLNVKSLQGLPSDSSQVEARNLFAYFARELGASEQEELMRKGQDAFVPVRADTWVDRQTGLKIYYIATDHELTVAAVTQSAFPLEQIFIRPDPHRFRIEQPAKRTLRDIDRPPVQNTERHVIQKSTQAHEAIPRHDTQPQERGQTQATRSSDNTSRAKPAHERAASSGGNSSILIWISAAAVAIIAAILLFKRISARKGRGQ